MKGITINMPGETTRTVTKHGKYSGVVALPTDYRRYYDLHPGASVKVIYDSLLLIIPHGAEGKLRERKNLIKKVLE